MSYVGVTEAVHYTTLYYFKQIGVIVKINGIYIAGDPTQISDVAKSYFKPVLLCIF